MGLVSEIALVSNFKQKVPSFGKYLARPLVPLKQVCIPIGCLRLSTLGGYETFLNTSSSCQTSQSFTASHREVTVLSLNDCVNLVEALSSWHKALFNMTGVRIPSDILDLSPGSTG